MQNVNRNEASRLNHYERSYAAEMLKMALELGAKEVAHSFMPRNLSVAIDRNWNFDILRRTHKRRWMRAVWGD